MRRAVKSVLRVRLNAIRWHWDLFGEHVHRSVLFRWSAMHARHYRGTAVAGSLYVDVNR